MANELVKNQGGNLHEFVQNICCSPTGCGGWGCRIVTQRDTLGYIYMSLSGSGVNDGYSFTQRVALGYIYMSLSGSCMHTNVVQKARRAKTHIARGNALGTMGNAPGIMAMSLGQWATFTDKQNIS